MRRTCQQFIQMLPKAELHVHIEGTMEPEQLVLFAQRNNIAVPENVLDQSKKKYIFSGLASFLSTYAQATTVLQQEIDFYDLMIAYLKKAAQQGVLHTEIFFDLQIYEHRKILPRSIINGMHRALIEGKKSFGITGSLIMCFLRDLDEADAFATLELIQDYRDKIIGVGLASLEQGNPPSKFERVFAAARAQGYHIVAHAGEGSPEYIDQTLTVLHAERIDHGFSCLEDQHLVQKLKKLQIPLTVCPLSNVALGYYKTIADHPLKKIFNAGLNVSIHSDDPAFFGGYVADNYWVARQYLGFSCNELIRVAQNSFTASFLDAYQKQTSLEKLAAYCAQNTCECK